MLNKEVVKKYKKEFDAWLDGASIQFKDSSDIEWRTFTPSWSSTVGEYRIRPKRIEEWLNVYKTGTVVRYPSQKDAIKASLRAVTPIERVAVHVKEV